MCKKIRKFRLKFHRKKKYLKDKALVNFLLQHEHKVNIDFSKIKIPPFLSCLKDNQTTKFHNIPLPQIDFQFHFSLIEPTTNESSFDSYDISDFNTIG